jgi:hypothetical protein
VFQKLELRLYLNMQLEISLDFTFLYIIIHLKFQLKPIILNLKSHSLIVMIHSQEAYHDATVFHNLVFITEIDGNLNCHLLNIMPLNLSRRMKVNTVCIPALSLACRLNDASPRYKLN